MNDDLLNDKTAEAMENLGLDCPVDIAEDVVARKLAEQIEKNKRDREIQQHNVRVDFKKAFKERKTKEEIEDFQRTVVEELITTWVKNSNGLRVPTVAVGGIAIDVAQFFKDNFKKVPNTSNYDEMIEWVENVHNHLADMDKAIFNFLRDNVMPEKLIQVKADHVEENAIGSSSHLIPYFTTYKVFFAGSGFWSGFFLGNENVTKDEKLELTHNHEDLLTGKLGKFRGTALFTDGFAHPQAKCLLTDEAFFVDTPYIQTKEQPRLHIKMQQTIESNENGVCYDGLDWYKFINFSVTGEDFVKAYCQRVVLTQ